MDVDVRALTAKIESAYPDRGVVLGRFAEGWLARNAEHDFLRCVLCRQKSGGMGVATGERPFFGRAGGWDEAGGVRWFCLACTSEADALLGSRSLDAMLADIVRALADEPPAIDALQAAFAARPPFTVLVGECFACGTTARVAKGASEAICARCAATALVAFERGSASTR